MNINIILEDLKFNKSQRTKDSLDQLNTLLETYFNSGKNDYSIATIGRISKAEGGIGTVSIRNKTGEHFRLLINAWATKANTTMKKPPIPHSRKHNLPLDMELLKRLDDPVLRAVFGQIIAEKKKLVEENRRLKQSVEVVIDMRPKQIIDAEQVHQKVEILSNLQELLVPSEIEALKDSIDEKKMAERGWILSKHGVIKDEYERPLFKIGFVLAIKKILSQV